MSKENDNSEIGVARGQLDTIVRPFVGFYTQKSMIEGLRNQDNMQSFHHACAEEIRRLQRIVDSKAEQFTRYTTNCVCGSCGSGLSVSLCYDDVLHIPPKLNSLSKEAFAIMKSDNKWFKKALRFSIEDILSDAFHSKQTAFFDGLYKEFPQIKDTCFTHDRTNGVIRVHSYR